MRKSYEPFILCKYPALLEELNNLAIAIKVHHVPGIPSAAARHQAPKWEDVLEIVEKSMVVALEQRENTIRY